MPTVKPALYLGLISGTSMDGVDAALVQFDDNTCRIIDAELFPYDSRLKRRLLAAKHTPESITLDELGRMHREVGYAFAKAALAVLDSNNAAPADVLAIGSHGQTIRHRTDVKPAYSLQIGDPNTIVVETGITTVADFRGKDIALGGEGAPLAPAFHHWLFRSRRQNHAVVNLGGIANVTLLRADGSVAGFDTGPANGLMDAWIESERGLAYDANGQLAAAGSVDQALLEILLAEPFFSRAPPKSTGFEQFNLRWLRRVGGSRLDVLSTEDVLATLSALSAKTVAGALGDAPEQYRTVYLCGGGVHNADLRRRISGILAPIPVETTEAIGVHPDWVEAALCAWLARETLAGRAGNLPQVTGARKSIVLGAIYP